MKSRLRKVAATPDNNVANEFMTDGWEDGEGNTSIGLNKLINLPTGTKVKIINYEEGNVVEAVIENISDEGLTADGKLYPKEDVQSGNYTVFVTK